MQACRRRKKPGGDPGAIIVQVKLGGSLFGLNVPVVEDILLPAGSSLEDLVERIAAQRGGQIRSPNTIAVVNGSLVAICGYDERILADGDHASFFCMMVGG